MLCSLWLCCVGARAKEAHEEAECPLPLDVGQAGWHLREWPCSLVGGPKAVFPAAGGQLGSPRGQQKIDGCQDRCCLLLHSLGSRPLDQARAPHQPGQGLIAVSWHPLQQQTWTGWVKRSDDSRSSSRGCRRACNCSQVGVWDSVGPEPACLPFLASPHAGPQALSRSPQAARVPAPAAGAAQPPQVSVQASVQSLCVHTRGGEHGVLLRAA